MNKFYRKRNERQGFTLVEVMISLLIVSISFFVIEITMSAIHKQADNYSRTEFYLYLSAIEDHGYQMKRQPSKRLILTKDHKTYYVYLVNDKLVMSTTKGGYMPLLKNVKAVKWDYQKPMLVSQLTMNHGMQLTGKSRLSNE